MPQPIPYWAVKDTIIVPATERGQAKLDWFKHHPKPARYGRVNSIDQDIISVLMFDEDDQLVGSSNLWFKRESVDWSEDDWKPAELKLISTDAPIQFICPTCGKGHRRGYVDGVSVFRCLGCGYTGEGNSYRPPTPPRTAWARVLDD
jgi:ribosomal protein L37AE/L43A